MEQALTDSTSQRDGFFSSKKNDLAALENKIMGKLSFINEKHKELEESLTASIKENTNSLRGEIEREAAARNDAVDSLRDTLEVILKYLRVKSQENKTCLRI